MHIFMFLFRPQQQLSTNSNSQHNKTNKHWWFQLPKQIVMYENKTKNDTLKNPLRVEKLKTWDVPNTPGLKQKRCKQKGTKKSSSSFIHASIQKENIFYK